MNVQCFNIINKTLGKIPSVDFLNVKNTVLGKKYELSLVFIGQKKSRTLNQKYRGKNKPTNILSFPLDKNSGEILICLSVAKKEAPIFEMNFEKFTAFLFIHGLLHLKGLSHGSTMERMERKLLKQFSF